MSLLMRAIHSGDKALHLCKRHTSPTSLQSMLWNKALLLTLQPLVKLSDKGWKLSYILEFCLSLNCVYESNSAPIKSGEYAYKIFLIALGLSIQIQIQSPTNNIFYIRLQSQVFHSWCGFSVSSFLTFSCTTDRQKKTNTKQNQWMLHSWKCSRAYWIGIWAIWLMEGVPVHGRRIGTWYYLKSFLCQNILWFHNFKHFLVDVHNL